MKTIKQAPSLVDQTYRAILDGICDGSLKPGERLTQEGLAEKLSVSRQPISQALQKLKQQKFLVDVGRRGVAVASRDERLERCIYELRLAIDPLAAAFTAQRADAKTIARLEHFVESGKSAARNGQIAHLIQNDVEFHLYLYRASGNDCFVDAMQHVWDHLRRTMSEVLRKQEYKWVWDEHDELVKAIAESDPTRAAEIARNHLYHAATTVQVTLPSFALH